MSLSRALGSVEYLKHRLEFGLTKSTTTTTAPSASWKSSRPKVEDLETRDECRNSTAAATDEEQQQQAACLR
jgi:hypothetical protein